MALVPHKITALAESDAQGTDGKNIVAGAVVSLYDTTGAVVTLFDDAAGSNGSTTKQTDAEGQVVVYVNPGEYDEEINGGTRRRVVVSDNGLRSQLADPDSTVLVGGVAASDLIAFDNVSSLKSANLEVGKVVRTAGYFNPNDGGEGQYLIVAGGTGTEDSGSFHNLDNGNQAKLLVGETVRVKQFGVVADGVTDDYTALTNVVSYAQQVNKPIQLEGSIAFGTTISYSGNPVTWLGDQGASWRTGTSLSGSVSLDWIGGASPMILSSTVGDYFEGIQVRNFGSATDFMGKPSGQRVYMDRMSFVTGSGESTFSRSVIRSSGNFLGYSEFSAISCKGAAPVFIDIDGLGSPNGITPITINGRSIFETGGSDLTVVKIKNENVEQIQIYDCTFNEKGPSQLTAVDTTDTPQSVSINTLYFCNNEIDYGSGSLSTSRFARLENVRNIIWDSNKANWGGDLEAGVELINSHVTSANNNDSAALNGPYFNADANSTVTVGRNGGNNSNTQGMTNNIASVKIKELPYSSVMIINGQDTHQSSTPIFRVDVTDNLGWQVRVATTKPYWIAVGTVFIVQVRNVSGGVISAGGFTNGFASGINLTAPSDGSNVSYMFYWDGAIAVPINNVAPTEVSNT